MNEQQLSRIRVYLTGMVALTIWMLLLWQHLHGGIPSHHLLQRADMPAISNAWGGLLLPIITWFLLGRVRTRILSRGASEARGHLLNVTLGFVFASLYGASLSILFVNEYSEASSVLFQGIFLLALFFRIYREECILGFIISMTITFGAVLPTLFAAVISAISILLYHAVRFILRHVGRWIAGKKS